MIQLKVQLACNWLSFFFPRFDLASSFSYLVKLFIILLLLLSCEVDKGLRPNGFGPFLSIVLFAFQESSSSFCFTHLCVGESSY
jgi:hypothetical protein